MDVIRAFATSLLHARTALQCALALLLMACGAAREGATEVRAADTTPGAEAVAPATDLQSGEVAVFATLEGLVAVSLEDGSVTSLSAGSVDWCVVDQRAGVVWLSEHDASMPSGDTYQLAFYDLSSRGPTHVVVRGVPIDADERIIDHGEAGRLGGADTVSFRVALRLDLSGVPSVGPAIGCEGDGEVFCYQEQAESDDSWPPPLVPELEALRERVAALSVVTSDELTQIVERGRARPLHPGAAPLEAGPPVESVDGGRCAEVPENCGTSQVLPSGRLWLVVTDNDRGDYFHESQQLYDPQARRFLRSRDPSLRSETPFEGEDVEGLVISPRGDGGVIGDRVVHFERGVVWQRDEARACGWVGGGHRVGGPRG